MQDQLVSFLDNQEVLSIPQLGFGCGDTAQGQGVAMVSTYKSYDKDRGLTTVMAFIIL